ncbi:predicted protein [Nematostella vectensis]|uniref:G-protein coupled receptors family 1 profile domain-containing protein n=1 Tax=Nematostella vectensis TaxID=45351 RepID=A7RS86_NEMVE|nr:predicted protein [Nematostella vectensis]|eukprot:XP_001637828.1 predicted protein [Nematostella vectensis]
MSSEDNLSLENTTADRDNVTSGVAEDVIMESTMALTAKVSAYVIILALCLVGNTFLIVAVKRNVTGRMRTVSNLLIASIAASDILLSVWSIPERITRILTMDSWLVVNTLGAVLCKLVNFTEKLSITVSVFHLGVLSVERFLAVYTPHRTVLTLKATKWIIVAIWVSSLAYWAPILYHANITAENAKVECAVRSNVQSWRGWYLAFIVLLCIVMILIPILYTALTVKLFTVPGMKKASQRQKTERMKRQVAIMIGVIIVTFYACFLPYWIGWVSCSYLPYPSPGVCNRTYKFVSILFSYANTAANPIICLLFIGIFAYP